MIRDARPDEAEALSALAMRSKAHWGYGEEFLERSRPALQVGADDLEVLDVRVAEHDGDVLGFAAVGPEQGAIELTLLFVEPAAIGTGVGRALLRDALARAAAAGVEELMIESDPNAEAFYLAHGARRIGERRSPSTGRMLPLLAIATRER